MSPTWFQLELTHPTWLIGLLALPVLAYYFQRSLVDFPRLQRWVSLAARAVIIVLIVLSLAGLTLLRPTHDKFVVFALDRSLSVGEDSRKKAEAFLTQAATHAGSNRMATLTFGAEPGAVEPGATLSTAQVDDKSTNLAAAIEVAAAAIPPSYVPEIVILSDGNQTAGDALKAALRAGVAVSTVPLQTRQDPDVQVSAVNVPPQVQQGEPFNVEVVIDSNQEQNEGEIEVYRGAHKVISEHRKLKKGENRFQFRQTTEQDRLATFTARVRGFHDQQLDNNSDFGMVFTSGKPRVLVVESDPKAVKELQWALEEQEMQVDVRPPQG
ncbi:MAG TPA: BatA domain-containing protein, partial [Isosphaeraceae bacterium]|nr:BatA domain-containing protein [Isosphaeraceae bacterium]